MNTFTPIPANLPVLPAYRAYVEDAFKKGARIECCSKFHGKWIREDHLRRDGFNWDILNYRVAPSQLAPEKAATVIRYRNASGFGDTTDYLEWDGTNTWIVKTNGERMDYTKWWALKDMDERVKRGVWTKETIAQESDKAAEVDYFSEEYQVALFKRWAHGSDLVIREYWSGQAWKDIENVFLWNKSIAYREKPAPPAPIYDTVPLDDYRVSELLRVDGSLCIITGVNDDIRADSLDQKNTYHFSFIYLTISGEIHRNGQWQPCSKQVERKG